MTPPETLEQWIEQRDFDYREKDVAKQTAEQILAWVKIKAAGKPGCGCPACKLVLHLESYIKGGK